MPKRRRKVAALGSAPAGMQLPPGVPQPPGQDQAGPLTHHAAYNTAPQLQGTQSSGAASTASTLPTMPVGLRSLTAETQTITPKYIFALRAKHAERRARSEEPRARTKDNDAQIAAARGFRGILVDSGAQITAFPHSVLKDKSYPLARSGISRIQAVDGPRCSATARLA